LVALKISDYGGHQGLKPIFLVAPYAALKAPLFHGNSYVHEFTDNW
jgi:hypothetical protein